MNIFNEETDFVVQSQPWNFSFKLWLRRVTHSTGQPVKVEIAATEFKEFSQQDEDRGVVPPASIELRRNEGQKLIDALWSAGLRPSEGMGSVGQLDAVQKHLADMRHLVFESIPSDMKVKPSGS